MTTLEYGKTASSAHQWHPTRRHGIPAPPLSDFLLEELHETSWGCRLIMMPRIGATDALPHLLEQSTDGKTTLTLETGNPAVRLGEGFEG